MNCAIIKQKYDCFGPWQPVKWSEGIDKLLSKWPGKVSYFELTLLLQADWFIVPQSYESGYTKELFNRGINKIIDRYVQCTSIKDIPVEEYDLIISMDPILGIPKKGRTIFAYYANEHWDTPYTNSIKGPLNLYDYFFAHLLSLSDNTKVISFPYLYCPSIIRPYFRREEKEAVFLDWRSITALTKQDLWSVDAENYYTEIKGLIKNSFCNSFFGKAFFGISDPPEWNSARKYYQALAISKYFISIGRNSGAGQGLLDAVSMDCICLGSKNRIYHQRVCHPDCLYSSLSEALKELKRIQESTIFQKEILEYQNKRLNQEFEQGPLEKLKAIIHE